MIKKLFLIVNTLCNQSCDYCYYNIGVEEKINGFLDPEKLRMFLDKKIEQVSITGGEPLLNPYLFDYLKILRRTTNHIILSTNGRLISDELIDKLESFNVKKVFLSLDSLSNSSHDKYRSQSHRSSLGAIRKLLDSKIKVNIATVVTSENIREIFEIQRFSLNNNCKFWPQAVYIPSDKLRKLRLTSISSREWAKIIRSIPKDLSQTRAANFLRHYYGTFILKQTNHILGCGFKNQIVINANGDIKLCFHSKVIGNIKNISLSQIKQDLLNPKKCFGEQCFQYSYE